MRNLNETMMEKYMFDTTITKAIDDMQKEVTGGQFYILQL